jgi:hypothetical protein
MLSFASAMEANWRAFGRASRSLPLNDSMCPFRDWVSLKVPLRLTD